MFGTPCSEHVLLNCKAFFIEPGESLRKLTCLLLGIKLLYSRFTRAQVAEPENNDRATRKKLDAINLESAVDQQIREAMERGDFDNLRGAGKPLDLARDPNVPQDWELAFNLLKNAGFAPDWIETLGQVRADREKLYAPLRRFLENPPKQPAERERQRAALVEQFRAQAHALNRAIDTYNLKAPSPQVHLRRIRIDFEVETFLSDPKQKS